MKLENKIKKYIKLISETTNTVDKQHYTKKLNECKKELIDLLCYNDHFMYCLYSANHDTENGWKKQIYVNYFIKTYNIKNIYTTIDINANTCINNIDFNI